MNHFDLDAQASSSCYMSHATSSSDRLIQASIPYLARSVPQEGLQSFRESDFTHNGTRQSISMRTPAENEMFQLLC